MWDKMYPEMEGACQKNPKANFCEEPDQEAIAEDITESATGHVLPKTAELKACLACVAPQYDLIEPVAKIIVSRSYALPSSNTP